MSEKLDELLVYRKIELAYPIKNGAGEEIKVLNIRRAKAKDLRRMQQKENTADQEFFLIAQLTGLVPEDIDELDIADYAKVQTALTDMQKGK